MRCRRTIPSLLVIICLAATSHAEGIRSSAEEIIRDWVAIVNMNDPEKLLAFYDQSEEMEVVVSTGLRFRGYKAVQKALKTERWPGTH